MPTPNSTPETPDDPTSLADRGDEHGPRLEPIDPTLTFDSYTNKQAPQPPRVELSKDPAPDETVTPATPRVPRMRTVVIGLVLLVIAGAVLVGQLTDVTVNAGAVLLALMIGGGVLLIAGARRS